MAFTLLAEAALHVYVANKVGNLGIECADGYLSFGYDGFESLADALTED
jgi:hypothetical protein